MLRLAGGVAMATGASVAWPAVALDATAPAISPDAALELLLEGNRLFMADQIAQPAIGRERRLEIARRQQPFAVLVGCSDSRVSPELLFGRGLGELFIVRNAGNTVDLSALGSIEFAVAELGVPLVVVLGHKRCGAVAAAVELVERNAEFPGVIGDMIEPILPAAIAARHEVGTGDHDALVDVAVRENVRRVVARLRSSQAVLIEPQQAGRLKIVGAHYDLDDGKVEFFDAG